MADNIDEVIERERDHRVPNGGDIAKNDPSDSGGLTKFGISQKYHPTIDIEHLTREGARAIYIEEYLQRPGIHTVQPQFLQDQLFDIAVNIGTRWAVNTFQFLLDVPQDGHIGPKTLAALALCDPRSLNNRLCRAREAYYRHLAQVRPKDKKFLKGWLVRAGKFLIP